METDDVAPAQQFIQFNMLDRHLVSPMNMTFESEQLAAKGAA